MQVHYIFELNLFLLLFVLRIVRVLLYCVYVLLTIRFTGGIRSTPCFRSLFVLASTSVIRHLV